MTILERLLCHDAWTTRALLVLSSGLADADLDREFDLGHRSLRRTFVHIIGNMECWCDLMNGQPQRASDPGVANQTIPRLIERLDVVAGRLLELGRKVEVENRVEETFVDYLDMPPTQKRLGTALVHLATHGMHHRAQCLYMMRRLGVQNLIEGDVFSWEKANQNEIL